MAPAQRYLFERGFHSADGQRDGRGGAETMVPIAELERARTEGVLEGRTAALAEALTAAEHRAAAALEAILASLRAIDTDLTEARAQAIDAGMAVAAAIVRKLLPDYYQREAENEIEAMVATLLPRLLDSPKVGLRVGPDLEQALTSRIERLAEQIGFDGRFAVIIDPTVTGGDCRIDWGAGHAVREADRLWQEIEGLLADVMPGAVRLLTEAAGSGAAAPPPVPISNETSTACDNGGDNG